MGGRSEVELTVPAPLPACTTDKAAVTTKLLLLVPVPTAVVTLTSPVVAPAGTTARIAVMEVTVKIALTPLNATVVAPAKWSPLIVTVVPTGPLVGEKLAITGALATVYEPALVAVPAGVVTVSGPLLAPAGTVAWIAVSEITVKLAVTPLNATVVVPVKLVPLIVTLVPTGPLVGEKLAIVGGTTTVNPRVLGPVPPAVVTLTGPVVAPAGTAVWTAVSDDTVKPALTPLNATAVVPMRFVPLMVTAVPTGPLAGERLAMVGGLSTVNVFALVAVPPGVVTLSGPVAAPAGTAVWIALSEETVKLALTPLNATAVAPLKLLPLMVTLAPTGPLVGVKLEIAGAFTTVNPPELVAVPPRVATLMVPDEAPAGTVAWMALAEVTVKFALAPLKATADAPGKFTPLRTPLVPTGPRGGGKPQSVGRGPAPLRAPPGPRLHA